MKGECRRSRIGLVVPDTFGPAAGGLKGAGVGEDDSPGALVSPYWLEMGVSWESVGHFFLYDIWSEMR